MLVDSHLKWVEVFETTSTATQKTVEILRRLFAAYGLPEELVSDNGPPFTSTVFKSFRKSNGIKHTLVPPYHLASNGAAERAVGILKQTLLRDILDRKSGGQSISLQHRMSNFLIKYRSTPHRITGRTSAELFLGRPIRTRFSLLKPSLQDTVESKQADQKRHYDARGTKERRFQE